jgi:hypothetical protein
MSPSASWAAAGAAKKGPSFLIVACLSNDIVVTLPFCAIFSTMPEYVIEREIPGAGQWNEDQIREASTQSLEVLRGMGAQIKWIHSYVTDDKIYCVYLAPDETLIREHARQLGVPANRISAVRRMIDPARYA